MKELPVPDGLPERLKERLKEGLKERLKISEGFTSTSPPAGFVIIPVFFCASTKIK